MPCGDYNTDRADTQSFLDHAGAYVLMDSWYTNPGVLDSCREKGCHLIGAMKTNRILYPEGKRTSASDLAASLDRDCFHPVTVKGRDYLVYRYEGALNKIDCVVVLLSYPAKAFGKKNALRVFLCSDGEKIAIKANINGSAVMDDDTSGETKMSYRQRVYIPRPCGN